MKRAVKFSRYAGTLLVMAWWLWLLGMNIWYFLQAVRGGK